jgi:hypothetical protein
MKFTTLDYCQYLLSSQINYTVTNLADHLKRCSHDTINLFLKSEKITSRMLWEQVKLVIQTDKGGYLLFDDTVIDKRFAPKIELTRRQYSGNEKLTGNSRDWSSYLHLYQSKKRAFSDSGLPHL